MKPKLNSAPTTKIQSKMNAIEAYQLSCENIIINDEADAWDNPQTNEVLKEIAELAIKGKTELSTTKSFFVDELLRLGYSVEKLRRDNARFSKLNEGKKYHTKILLSTLSERIKEDEIIFNRANSRLYSIRKELLHNLERANTKNEENTCSEKLKELSQSFAQDNEIPKNYTISFYARLVTLINILEEIGKLKHKYRGLPTYFETAHRISWGELGDDKKSGPPMRLNANEAHIVAKELKEAVDLLNKEIKWAATQGRFSVNFDFDVLDEVLTIYVSHSKIIEIFNCGSKLNILKKIYRILGYTIIADEAEGVIEVKWRTPENLEYDELRELVNFQYYEEYIKLEAAK